MATTQHALLKLSGNVEINPGPSNGANQVAQKLSATAVARIFERTKMASAVGETALGFLAPSSLVCWQKTYKNTNPSQMLGTGLRGVSLFK